MSMEHISTYTDEKSKKLNKGPRFVRWAVMLGIVIVLNVFFMVIRSLIFPEPQYTDFCPASPAPAPMTEQACVAAGDAWTMAQNAPIPATPTQVGAKISPETPTGYCDTTTKCNASYQTADDQYQMDGFIVLIGLGLIAIIIGVLPIGSSIVSAGLSYGGVLSFVIASAQYWSSAGNWLRLAISVIALVALIYIGIKRFKD